jgi:hypothetical protein
LGDQTRTAPLLIIADPRVPNSDAAITAKTDLALATYHDIDSLHRAVNDIRTKRKTLAGRGGGAGLDARLARIEQALMQVNMNGSEANLAFPGMLNEQLAGFAGTLEDADTPPTTQQQALYDSLHKKLEAQLALWKAASRN